MWNDSDRLGYSRFLNYQVKNNAFVIFPPGRKGSVWYDPNELREINQLLKQKIISDLTLVSALKETLEKYWEVILPYLKQEREIKDGKEFEEYYNNLVEWWSAMNTAFNISDMDEVSQDIKNYFFEKRVESEKYTEQMNRVLMHAWRTLIPAEANLAHFVSPHEAVQILRNDSEKDMIIANIKQRTGGCGMFNGKIYGTLDDFHKALLSFSILLHDEEVVGIEEVKGSVAFKGVARGRVRIINSFADMPSFLEKEILITEMTNPDYIPIIKKAVSIVTDEGGMTCHAAIAAREFKVPCVVGTKIATQVFKDGDLVEVDADRGIVKIIKRGKI
jgi:phosphohistidine swiveling domain-containing protein